MSNTFSFMGSKTRFLGCLVGAVSAASSFAINNAASRGDLSRLLNELPVAVGIGLVLGVVYFVAMQRVLPKLAQDQVDEIWSGLTWFNISGLSLWAGILPIPTQYIEFCVGFVFSGGCARLVASVYTVFGASLSNRKRFANTFVMLALTIMLVISVVKASLALSLGLVGALSIIRFRTAIKEPEELAFLFFTVAIGLGFGAGKFGITLAAFWAICIGFILFRKIRANKHMENAYLVTLYGPGKDLLSSVSSFLDKNEVAYEFTRLETSDTSSHVSFLVEINTIQILEVLGQQFREQYPDANMTIVQARNLI
ncbi:hypothetical protein SYK_25390 [Pseudodesulfovibrio nedwellii]|uniref:DUF4956 domain-containing protein n=1 Tax=Pseudodesulfovibrio nedwellii TaxID=2973072 RepID=A0ABM8B316_9BACT|nr:DUF4956 domain-containing protein [Pseudodesulfovibrio nedwellii]BDQ38179.1 hypothetical protein SYK_25390 [Pseudodesulfovibrio nedwellii]